MGDNLIAIEDMAEIPKDAKAASQRRGGSKGVNLFLARQKLIADMMEQEEQESSEKAVDCEFKVQAHVAQKGSSTTKVHKPVACGPGKENYSSSISSADTQQPTMSATEEPISEIPNSAAPASGGGKSKGVNLFLARQKLIADMMAAEEEAERAAEEGKIHEEEEKRKQEELRHKQEAEKIRQEEVNRKEREKLEESERAKAARAARFRSSKPLPEQTKAEPEIPWVKKKSGDKSSASASGEPRKTLYQLLSSDRK